VVVDALSWMFDITKQSVVSNQTTDVNIFFLQPIWLHEIFKYLIIGIFLIHYSQEQKKN
jgi:hypothetical protein